MLPRFGNVTTNNDYDIERDTVSPILSSSSGIGNIMNPDNPNERLKIARLERVLQAQTNPSIPFTPASYLSLPTSRVSRAPLLGIEGPAVPQVCAPSHALLPRIYPNSVAAMPLRNGAAAPDLTLSLLNSRIPLPVANASAQSLGALRVASLVDQEMQRSRLHFQRSEALLREAKELSMKQALSRLIDSQKDSRLKEPTHESTTEGVTKGSHHETKKLPSKETMDEETMCEDDTEFIPALDKDFIPLGIEGDESWLSIVSCFLRNEFLEVIRANQNEEGTTLKVHPGQIGIRCRFCAHLPLKHRARRSRCWPSSTSRIYQSVSQMVREHFPCCPAVPRRLQFKLKKLKTSNSQGATNSLKYWSESAKTLGMVDTEDKGIAMSDATWDALWKKRSSQKEGEGGYDRCSPCSPSIVSKKAMSPVDDEGEASFSFDPSHPLIKEKERGTNSESEYLFILLHQVQPVFLCDFEQKGQRRSLDIGFPGLGCRHCRNQNGGFGRIFPTKRKYLPAKLKDMEGHLRRCTFVPKSIKERMLSLGLVPFQDSIEVRRTLDLVWERLMSTEPCLGQNFNQDAEKDMELEIIGEKDASFKQQSDHTD